MLGSSSCQSRKLSSPAVAVAVHEAAHKVGSSELHDLALHFMEAAGLPHLTGFGPDDLDAARTNDDPSAVCLARRAVARTSDGELVWAADVDLPSVRCGGVSVSDGEPVGECEWVYGLYLIESGPRERFVGEGLAVGDVVPVAEPRSRGNFRFPAIAQRLEGELHQLHVAGGKLLSIGRSPERAQGLPALLGSRGVWLAVGPDSKVIDVLVSGHHQVWRRPLRERILTLPASCSAEWRLLEEPKGLAGLPRGWWLIRWAEEQKRPCEWSWFRFLAGGVRPGQLVPTVKATASSMPGCCLYQRLPDGLRAQLHVEAADVAVFVRGSAYDVAPLLPGCARAFQAAAGCAVVLDGYICGPGSARALRRALSRREKIGDAASTFAAFDCMFADGQDLHETPLSERLEVLRNLPLEPPIYVMEASEAEPPPPYLARDARAPYPLTGECDTWLEVRDADHKDDGRNEGHADKDTGPEGGQATGAACTSEAASAGEGDPARAWVDADGRVIQDDSFVRLLWLRSSQDMEGAGDVLLIEAPPARSVWLGLEFSVGGERMWSTLRERSVACRDLGAIRCIEWSPDGKAATIQGRHYDVAGEGRGLLGVQTRTLHEVFAFFTSPADIAARLLVRRVRSGPRRPEWEARAAATMAPALLRLNAEEVRRSAQQVGGWVAWNTESVRLLAAEERVTGVPLNWEEAVCALEDDEFSDYSRPQAVDSGREHG